jgi:hypothetical protein
MPKTGFFDRIQAELDGNEKAAGLSLADVLSLPDPHRGLVNWIMREGQVDLAAVSARLGQSEEQARAAVADLVSRGFLREFEQGGRWLYQVRLGRKRGRELPANLWQALDDKTER